MSFNFKHSEFKFLVDQASKLLGAAGRPLLLDFPMEEALRQMGRLEQRKGIDAELPLETFNSGKRGHETAVGLEKYRIRLDGDEISVVHVCNGFEEQVPAAVQDPWVVASQHYRRLYRVLRQKVRRQVGENDVAPVMAADEQERLFNNTIGFLQHGREELKRYGVPQKRGVLLIGEPGNGKTMACRWLLAQCRRLGFEWQYVGIDEYQRAREHNMTRSLFRMTEPGIVLFDDFDLGIRDREKVGPTHDHSMLLPELDGVVQRQGVVYMFTTNARLPDLDPAFLRRGRMDQVIHFPRPEAELRRRLILEFWHPDIKAAIDVERVVSQTDGRSFADLEELKKLLVLHRLDTGSWDLAWAWNALQLSDDPGRKTKKIGFGIGASLRRRMALDDEDNNL